MLGSSPQGCWRSRYEPAREKCIADLWLQTVHRVMAMNRHVAHIVPTRSRECLLCDSEEPEAHLFLHCRRLDRLLTAQGLEHRAGSHRGRTRTHIRTKEKICCFNKFINKSGQSSLSGLRGRMIQGRGTRDTDKMLAA